MSESPDIPPQGEKEGENVPTIRTFVGYRPKVPEHYIEGGFGNPPAEPQYQGVVFDDGTVAIRWLTDFRSTSLWVDFATFEAVHGHADYATKIVWDDTAEWDCPNCEGMADQISAMTEDIIEYRSELKHRD